MHCVLKNKRKLENFMKSVIFSHCFLVAGATLMMLLLFFSTGCYSNTLIDADTYVSPIKSMVLTFKTFFYFKIL